MNFVKRQVKVDPRLLQQLSTWAIKRDLIRALVELITNSDDSYKRLEEQGTPGSGLIMVRVSRKHKHSIIEVIDEAEGFNAKRMDERIGTYAADTSGFSDGKDVRGLFGRGLKDAILALGKGSIKSIKDGFYNECLLDKIEYSRNEPIKLRKRDKKKVESQLKIYNHGTNVSITIKNPKVAIPQFDNIIESLSNYYSLRDINSSNRRNITIVEINDSGVEKGTPSKIAYRSPIGRMVLDKSINIAYGSISPSAKLTIYMAKDALDQEGPCRNGGILICGKSSIHDISLFAFENNQYAKRIYGRLDCAFIDELIKDNEPVISDKRSGLEWKHEFAKSMTAAIDKELKPIIESIRKEEEETKKRIENEKTRQRFKKTIHKLNQIAKNELGKVDSVTDGDGNG